MHITANIWDRKDARHPGLIQRMYTVTIHRPGGATDFYTTPEQYRRIYAWLLRRGAVNNPYNLPDYNVLVYKTGAAFMNPLTPADNTETRQQAADELEQAEYPAEIDGQSSDIGFVSYGTEAQHTRAARQPDLFAARVDDLPIFSGTAPRATVRPFVETPASPRQPKLF